MCLALACRLGKPAGVVETLARELADAAAAGGDASSAAAMLLEYCADVDGAVAALAAGREWREALRLAHARHRGDLVDTVVAPSAAQV